MAPTDRIRSSHGTGGGVQPPARPRMMKPEATFSALQHYRDASSKTSPELHFSGRAAGNRTGTSQCAESGWLRRTWMYQELLGRPPSSVRSGRTRSTRPGPIPRPMRLDGHCDHRPSWSDDTVKESGLSSAARGNDATTSGPTDALLTDGTCVSRLQPRGPWVARA